MKMLLPITADIPYKTYQNYAFYLSIALLHKNFINVLYNSFIDLEWQWDKLIILSDFNNIHINYVEFNSRNLTLDDIDIIDAIKNKINAGSYICGMYDEFYIKDKKYYNTKHRWHDYYLYGYDDSEGSLYSMGYIKGGVYGSFKIKYNDFIEAIRYREGVEYINDSYFSSYIGFIRYKPNELCFDKLNICEIYKNIYNFYAPSEPVDLMNHCHGHYCYDALNESLKSGSFDLRHFRVLYENKELMKQRILYIRENTKINIYDEIIGDYENLVEKPANVIFNYAIKYAITKNKLLSDKITDIMAKMRLKEAILLNRIMKNLDTEVSNLLVNK